MSLILNLPLLSRKVHQILTGKATLANLLATNIKDSTRAYAHAYRSGALTLLSGTLAKLDFDTIEYDTAGGISGNGSWNAGTGTSTWRYTVQPGHAGMYLIQAGATVPARGASSDIYFDVMRSGTYNKRLYSHVTAAGLFASGSAVIYGGVGDYFEFRLLQSSGAGCALSVGASETFMSLTRLVTNL